MLNALPLVLLWTPLYDNNTNDKHSNGDPHNSLDIHTNGANAEIEVRKQNNISSVSGTLDSITVEVTTSVHDNKVKGHDIGQQTIWQSFLSLLRNKQYMCCAVGLSLGSAATYTLMIFVQDIILDAGFSKKDASLALTLINVFSIIGRLVPGFLLQTKDIAVTNLLSMASVLMTIGVIGTILFSQLELKLISLCIAGIPMGLYVTMFSMMPYQLVHTGRLSTAIGLVMTFVGVLTVPSGLISGKSRDMIYTELQSSLCCFKFEPMSNLAYLVVMSNVKLCHSVLPLHWTFFIIHSILTWCRLFINVCILIHKTPFFTCRLRISTTCFT